MSCRVYWIFTTIFLCALCCHSLVLPKPKLQPRIIGGTKAKPGQFPYQVSVQLKGKHYCGGAIVDETHVVTAAHCLQKRSGAVPASQLAIKAGHVDLTSKKIRTVAVSEVIIHSGFNSRVFANDIALLKLATPLDFSDRKVIAPIDIHVEAVPDATECLVSGWGILKQNTTQMSDDLRYAEVQIENQRECKDKYANFNTVDKKMICAAAGKKDACEGDSGGPLACFGNLVGVVSFGVGCGLEEFPGVYTRVASHRKWILQKTTIKNSPFCKPWFCHMNDKFCCTKG